MNSDILPARFMPAVRLPGDGETVSLGAESMKLLFTADDTGGRLGLIDREVSPGFKSPPQRHTHSHEDWLGYVISGRLVFELDGMIHDIGAGGSLFVPRGTYFRWWNPQEIPARVLFVYMPGGFEAFFRDLVNELAPKADRIHDYPRTLDGIRRLHDRYGIVRAGADIPHVAADRS